LQCLHAAYDGGADPRRDAGRRRGDLLAVLPKLVPAFDFQHTPVEHVPAHVLSAVIGASLTIPVQDGRLSLGDFQSVVLLEFQGPAERQVEVRFFAAEA